MTDWKDERQMQVNPSWVIQILVGLIIAVVGWSINSTLGHMGSDIDEIKTANKQANLDRSQIRADMTALEIGLRGDRFTSKDWQREEQELERFRESINNQLEEIRRDIGDLQGKYK